MACKAELVIVVKEGSTAKRLMVGINKFPPQILPVLYQLHASKLILMFMCMTATNLLRLLKSLGHSLKQGKRKNLLPLCVIQVIIRHR
jgi:hypothetical protein